MLEKGGTALSAGEYEVSQHEVSEKKSWMEIGVCHL